MFMNVACPLCGHKCRVPERSMGQQVQCPACSGRFQCGSVDERSLQTRPLPADPPPLVQEAPHVQAVSVQPDQAIHYRCPACSKPLQSPAPLAGHKVNCPECGQRLQIPQASSSPHVAPVSSPVLAPAAPSAVPDVAPAQGVPSTAGAAAPRAGVKQAAPARPAQRESCLECGVDVTRRARILTCPDCGSLFCSAGCFREHCYHAHPSRRR